MVLANEEPERSPCCKVCVFKFIMKETFVDAPIDQPQAGSIIERIRLREEKA